ncbi:sensor histidine kinase [Hymenobacter cheonanensis]|uniref:sensor histidine kinase n=1 Tax=Hymenobacter sp. CA2-7 TaxID=3063993 RepID=UPI002712CE8B|nr:HAMP domain-containing sensor histidine kinase [Hymenobacter sp. CA2-7]MDO7885791.1 HAMP domain-containing sensor histidine kinase [Hymenobacter sp. CA2-7]
MQRRLRFIFGLLAVCLLGSYGFQAYWLYGSYQLATAQVERTAHEALEAVVQRQQLSRTQKVFNIRFNDYASPGDAPGRPHHWQIEQLDTGLTPAQAGRPWPAPKARPAAPPPTQAIRAARTDSLARQLSSFVISNWQGKQPVSVAQLARAYRAELRRRQVALPFRLDTLTAPAAAVAAGRAGFSMHTPAVQLNPVRGTAVVASFRPPRAFVLGRLAGALAGSALLLGLTTGCFALMLSTILRQKKLSEVKSDFINNMTHELKTPLATVSAAVEALQDFGALADAERTATYLSLARHELHRLASLVDKVLHIAVAERPGHPLALHPEPLHPAELVAELVRRHELQTTKHVRFDVSLSPTDTLLADRLHLAGALDNLLDNALKYSGDDVRIGVHGQPVAGGWQLTVADNGPGIAASYQEAVFEQFFRVPAGNLHPVKGFGLGLYYVRQVVAAHGGRVHVRPAPGGGSAFVVWLPAAITT